MIFGQTGNIEVFILQHDQIKYRSLSTPTVKDIEKTSTSKFQTNHSEGQHVWNQNI